MLEMDSQLNAKSKHLAIFLRLCLKLCEEILKLCQGSSEICLGWNMLLCWGILFCFVQPAAHLPKPDISLLHHCVIQREVKRL